jgi:hypothetical protein
VTNYFSQPRATFYASLSWCQVSWGFSPCFFYQ